MKLNRKAESLLYTERGVQWLAQFDPDDQEAAHRIATTLTLVSESEFERAVQSALEGFTAERESPIAFFAVREMNSGTSYFELCADPDDIEIDALQSGADHGSEARIATIIRNYCKTDPEILLNHPTLSRMRKRRCRSVVVVDDFIGSGERTSEFLDALWRDRTFKSWLSLAYVKVLVFAYSGTERGVQLVSKHKTAPDIVLDRGCPTYKAMPWGTSLRHQVRDVCRRYGSRTRAGTWCWDGYGHEMAALVFEHSCPDNTPAILWMSDDDKGTWQPLFPERVVLGGEKSVFPPEITRGDPLVTLLDVGQKRLATSGQLSRRGQLGEIILLLLALVARGQRRQSSLCFATGLNRVDCTRILDRCINSWEYLTPSLRLTKRGHAELDAARKFRKVDFSVPERGEDNYFPQQLRRATSG